MKETNQEKGSRGEKIGSNILKQLGFKEIWRRLDGDGRVPSYDLLAVRWTQKYAINVKFGERFALNYRNLERLTYVYKKHGFKPAYLFIKSPKKYWFYSLDITFPQRIDSKNQKLESFE